MASVAILDKYGSYTLLYQGEDRELQTEREAFKGALRRSIGKGLLEIFGESGSEAIKVHLELATGIQIDRFDEDYEGFLRGLGLIFGSDGAKYIQISIENILESEVWDITNEFIRRKIDINPRSVTLLPQGKVGTDEYSDR